MTAPCRVNGAAAVRDMEMLNGSAMAELWCGKRKITTFESGAAVGRAALHPKE